MSEVLGKNRTVTPRPKPDFGKGGLVVAFGAGIAVDLAAFILLVFQNTDPLTAQFISFIAAAGVVFAVRVYRNPALT